LSKHERAEARVERKRRRALRWRRERLVIFEDPKYANKHITRLLRGHPEKLRIETRLTIYQFESLATLLRENTNLEASRHASVEAKLGIVLYICGQGVSYRGASIHWEVSIS
jgi:hypothetical protein